MKTMFDDDVRRDIQSRIDRVTSDAPAQWGKMNSEQMLAHLTESLRMGTGELPVKSKRLPIRYFPLKQLILYVLPFPKGAPTAPELVPPDRRTVEASKAELARLLSDFCSRRSQSQWPEHPAFGKLSTRQWGILTYRHFDHHLRQFGV
jgi:Protein of unknown function (DUF1569)